MSQDQQSKKEHDEDLLRRQAERSRQAKALMENPLLAEAFDAVDAEISRVWRVSAGADAQGRENAYWMARALDALRTHLQSVMVKGRSAVDLLNMEGKG